MNNKWLPCLCSEHSVAETLSVARRVAEEAIDETISKAEIDTSNQVIHIFHSHRLLLTAVVIIITSHHKWLIVGILMYPHCVKDAALSYCMVYNL